MSSLKKEVKKMKIERLIAILVILLNTKKTTAAELSEKFEVSTRTIYRDLDSLLVSGVPVMTMQGVNGGVYIDESYKLDNQYFSLSEITNLIVGIKSLESAIDDNVLITALEKLKSLVPKEVSNDFENMIQQISDFWLKLHSSFRPNGLLNLQIIQGHNDYLHIHNPVA